LQNLVQKHSDPLVKLGAEGNEERLARGSANWPRVASAWKQSRAEAVWEEEGKQGGPSTVHAWPDKDQPGIGSGDDWRSPRRDQVSGAGLGDWRVR
jgi:hypothetical protein